MSGIGFANSNLSDPHPRRAVARRRSAPQGIDDLRAIADRGIMGDGRSPSQDHLCPDARVRGLLVHCSDYKCSHSIATLADQWPDDMRHPTSSRGFGATRAASVAPLRCGQDLLKGTRLILVSRVWTGRCCFRLQTAIGRILTACALSLCWRSCSTTPFPRRCAAASSASTSSLSSRAF
jgi:hypothetical protein